MHTRMAGSGHTGFCGEKQHPVVAGDVPWLLCRQWLVSVAEGKVVGCGYKADKRLLGLTQSDEGLASPTEFLKNSVAQSQACAMKTR